MGERLAKRASRERPDAIIGLADAIAAGAIQGVQAAGCDVPGDIMVAGCDGNPLAWGGAVPLTTCSPAGYEIGRKGVQMLVGQITATHELVRPFLLERASTVGQGAAHRSELSGLGAVRAFAELDMGSYL